MENQFNFSITQFYLITRPRMVWRCNSMINIILSKHFTKSTMNKMWTTISHEMSRDSKPRKNNFFKHINRGVMIKTTSWNSFYPLSNIINNNQNMCIPVRERKMSDIIKTPNIKWFNNKLIIHRHFLTLTDITYSLAFVTRQDKLTGILEKSRPIETRL